MINVIIPVYNEEAILTEKRDYYLWLKDKARLIFVDGQSSDRTTEVARRYGKVVTSKRGRAIQKNRGVEFAEGEHLLFLHVDTFIDSQAIEKIEEALKSGFCGGCLTQRIEGNSWLFPVFAKIVNFQARYFQVIDGDLGLFVRKNAFYDVGRFDGLPIMEDILFAKKLNKYGKITILPHPILASSRKWYTQGFLRTFFEYTVAYIQLWTRFRLLRRI